MLAQSESTVMLCSERIRKLGSDLAIGKTRGLHYDAEAAPADLCQQKLTCDHLRAL